MRYATMLALVLSLASCKDATAPTPTVNGSWSGTVSGQAVTLTLGQTGPSVTGSGTLSGTPRGTLAMSATGTYAHPSLSLTLSNTMTQPANISATMTNGALIGSVQGAGFTGQSIALYRR